jgi:hypothetical protein
MIAMVEYGDERLPALFWDRVSPEPNTGCWLWTGALNDCGYGGFWLNGKRHAVHRLASCSFGARTLEGHDVDHVCRVRCCVNPAHLRVATRSQNNANLAKRPGTASRFKGVARSGARWQARAAVDGSRVHLGSYATEEDAARAYDAFMLKRFGSFALTNEKMGLSAESRRRSDDEP